MKKKFAIACLLLVGTSTSVFASTSHRRPISTGYQEQNIIITGDDSSLAAELFHAFPVTSLTTSGIDSDVICSVENTTYSCTFFNGQVPVTGNIEWAEIVWQDGDNSYAALLHSTIKELPGAISSQNLGSETTTVSLSVREDQIDCNRIPERSYWFRDEDRSDRRRKCDRDDHRGCYEEVFSSSYSCKVRGKLFLEDV